MKCDKNNDIKKMLLGVNILVSYLNTYSDVMFGIIGRNKKAEKGASKNQFLTYAQRTAFIDNLKKYHTECSSIIADEKRILLEKQ